MSYKQNLIQKLTKLSSFPSSYFLSSVNISGSAKDLIFMEQIQYPHLHLSIVRFEIKFENYIHLHKSIDPEFGSD